VRFPRFPNLAAFALVFCCIHASASAPGSTKPILDLDLASELCDLRSQQPYNDPPAGVDFISENELVVYTVCHTEGALAERGGLQQTDPNHLKAVVVDLSTGAIKQRFDWPTRGRGSLLRVTHNGQLLLKLDNVIQILKPDKTTIASIRIPKVSPSDIVWAAMSPAVDALAVTLSSSAPDNKTVNGIAILDSRNLQPIARWHEGGDWWNLAASTKSVVHAVNDGAGLEFQGLENIEQSAQQWTSAWSGSRMSSHPLFVGDSILAFPAGDSVYLFDEKDKKLVRGGCSHFPDTSTSRIASLTPARAGRIAVSRYGATLGTVCWQAFSGKTRTGGIAQAEVYSVNPLRVIDSIPLENTTLSEPDLALSPRGSELAYIDRLHLQVFSVKAPSNGKEDVASRERINETVGAAPPPTPSQSPQADSTAVFRATARLVTVDVVATNNKGEFIPGLKAEDFTVREEGKVQQISSFSAHIQEGQGSPSPSSSSRARLPENQYTNLAAREPGQAVTMILFDLLNTASLDQVRARKQMVKFLQNLPPGQKVALFALGNRLSLIQGFSGDSNTLITAANLILSKGVPPIAPTSEAELQQAQVRADFEKDRGDQTAQKIADAMTSEAEAIRGMKACTMLDGMKALARAASGYPGRKTLVWLSADFPLPLYADDPKNAGPCQTKIRDAMNQMSAAEIAVYPVDLQGLATAGIAISTPNSVEGSLQQETTTASQRQTFTRMNLQATMDDLARETGGHAFYGTNDLQDAIARALQHGRNSYTLTYVPSQADWNGKYRKIDVKLTRSGVALSYRRGYYAVAHKELSGNQATQLLAEAMIPAVPESTMLPLRVRISPPDQQRKTVGIDYQLDAHDLSFTESPEHLQCATVELVATAWDSQYKDAGHLSNTLDMALHLDTYQEVLQNGITAHDDFELKPGTYTLRVGVIDRASQKIGTVDVPLVIPEH
jgi:VWFA-related protein